MYILNDCIHILYNQLRQQNVYITFKRYSVIVMVKNKYYKKKKN